MYYGYNSGYHGYSMSNNAVDAYEDGQKPMSRWSKKGMIDIINMGDPLYEISEEKKELVHKLPYSVLKHHFLTYTSYHHTSKYFNETEFYSVDFEKLEEITVDELRQMLSDSKYRKINKAEKPKPVIRKIKYLVWDGTRNHPHATEYTEEATIIGNWAFTKNGRKYIHARGFIFID